MHRTRSTMDRYGSSASKGVSGLAARPTRRPRSRIWDTRAAVSPTSTCTVHPVRARVPERPCREIAGRVGDHEVGVEEEPAVGPQGRDHRWADGQIGHEMTVHHVDVEPIGAAGDRRHGRGQAAEVGGEDRRSDAQRGRGLRSGHRARAYRGRPPGRRWVVRAHTPSRSSAPARRPWRQALASIGRFPSGWTVSRHSDVPSPAPAPTTAPSQRSSGALASDVSGRGQRRSIARGPTSSAAGAAAAERDTCTRRPRNVVQARPSRDHDPTKVRSPGCCQSSGSQARAAGSSPRSSGCRPAPSGTATHCGLLPGAPPTGHNRWRRVGPGVRRPSPPHRSGWRPRRRSARCSRPASTAMRQTPVSESPSRRARSTGAAPRHRGRSEKWRLTIGSRSSTATGMIRPYATTTPSSAPTAGGVVQVVADRETTGGGRGLDRAGEQRAPPAATPVGAGHHQSHVVAGRHSYERQRRGRRRRRGCRDRPGGPSTGERYRTGVRRTRDGRCPPGWTQSLRVGCRPRPAWPPWPRCRGRAPGRAGRAGPACACPRRGAPP